MSSVDFWPEAPLMQGTAHENCRAIVILPARNEEACLAATLDALAAQTDLSGAPIPTNAMETLLLLNNCTDASAEVVRQWQAMHPGFVLHLVERTLPQEVAHVGTARRLLMDTAWSRLTGRAGSAILSTDADTLVAPDWVAQNLRAIAHGADAVGGVIHLMEGDLESLPTGAREAYLRDHKYQRLIAELEHWLDPQDGDPWPRHLEHFGASLACTPQIYARAGGLPAVKPLEDVAFVDALRRVGAKLRHDPAVMVSTSARLDGRAEVGLSGQLRIWQDRSEAGQPHLVRSCEWLVHRFECLGRLRRVCLNANAKELAGLPAAWHAQILRVREEAHSVCEFLGAIDSERLIHESFRGESDAPISRTIESLEEMLMQVRSRASVDLKGSAVSEEQESRAA
jgi:hypothetical protein